MRTLAAFLLAATLACGAGETADTVVFVHRDRVTVRGEVQMVAGEGGEQIPWLWAPGTIVVFRADQTIAGHAGRAGTAYRIAEGGTLVEIGSVNLDRTDDEIAGRFGVEPAPGGAAP